MHTTKPRNLTRILLVAATAGTLALGASSNASASTEPPAPDASATSDTPVPTAGEPTTPEAAAFCEAELGVEAATNSEDPDAIEPAIETAIAAATDDVRPLLEAVVAAFETGPESPEFEASYTELLEWIKSNCGYAQLNVTASEYAFGGIPAELNAGPTIVSLANTGEEVHELGLVRVNDDVTLTLEELLATPEEDSDQYVTYVGSAFAFPDDIGTLLIDLTPGHYVAICNLPEHADPEMIAQMTGPDPSAPPGNNFGPQHHTLGMVQEFTVA